MQTITITSVRPALLSRALAAVLALTLACLAGAMPAAIAKPSAGRYVVTVADGHAAGAVARAVGATPRHVYSAALNGFAAQLTDAQAAALHTTRTSRLSSPTSR